MVKTLGRKSVLIISGVLFSIMFAIVMFFVNPAIDGGSGIDLLRLQLSFDKNQGLAIIHRWGQSGVANFKKYIVFDYIYALTYVLFLSSLLSFLVMRRENFPFSKVHSFICLAIISGILDSIENTMELFFIKYRAVYPEWLFTMNSFVSALKWGLILMVVAYAFALISRSQAGRST